MNSRSPKKNIFKIVHLDDHKIITRGMRDIITAAIPNCHLRSFNNPDKAGAYITKSIKEEKKIDLLLTDMVHGGQNGYDLANEIRIAEIKCKRNPMKIFLLSCIEGEHPTIQRGLKKKIFDNYLQKHSTISEIKTFVKSAV